MNRANFKCPKGEQTKLVAKKYLVVNLLKTYTVLAAQGSMLDGVEDSDKLNLCLLTSISAKLAKFQ